jgi:hypothetical protein
LLFLSASLLFLHNVTLHMHQSNGALQPAGTPASGEDESLLDYLVNSFQLDFGEGHLECFSQVESPASPASPVLFHLPAFPWGSPVLYPSNGIDCRKKVVPRARNEVLPPADHDAPSFLRAPPVFA